MFELPLGIISAAILHWFRHRDHWSDKSDGPDRLGQYVDKSDWSDSRTMLSVTKECQ